MKISRLVGGRENLNLLLQLLRFIPDKQYLKIIYRIRMGKKLDLKNPRTFNEKLQWLKLYDRKPEYTTMVDKYEAKKYVAERIGEEYIIPTLGVWDKFEDIDFDLLPDQFVLKCTHDSGGVVICRDKRRFDIEEARKKINRSLKCNFYWVGREWPYKDVKPRIIAEKYIGDEASGELIDYKMMCFHGKVMCTLMCTNRYSHNGLRLTMYDSNWNIMPLECYYPRELDAAEKPESYKKMVELSESLADELIFSRIDFYEVGKKPYFGEITLFSASGMLKFSPEEWDDIFGSWIRL